MSTTPTIRTALLSDAPRLAELSAVLGYPTSAATMAERLERLLGRETERVLVACLPSGRLVGWLHASEHELLETGLHAEILGLVVDAEQRGLGIGSLLIAAIEAWARGRGLERIGVRSNVVRVESHPFYERRGYVREKTQHAYRKTLAAEVSRDGSGA